jgi:hypothetical protein
MLASARPRPMLVCERGTGGTDSPSWSSLPRSRRSLRLVPFDLLHGLAAVLQVTDETGAVVAGALDRPWRPRGRSVMNHAPRADRLLIKPTAGPRPAPPYTPGRFTPKTHNTWSDA